MTDPDAEIAITLGATILQDDAETGRASLECVYDQCAHALFRYALALLGSPEDAEDAVQDVFARIARERGQLKKVESIKSYVFAATRNAAYSILRSRRRRDELQQAVCAESETGATAEWTPSVESTVLRQAFARLPTEQREVLVLKVFEEMKFKEIAETVGASINRVTSRYRYGIAKLRLALKENGNG